MSAWLVPPTEPGSYGTKLHASRMSVYIVCRDIVDGRFQTELFAAMRHHDRRVPTLNAFAAVGCFEHGHDRAAAGDADRRRRAQLGSGFVARVWPRASIMRT